MMHTWSRFRASEPAFVPCFTIATLLCTAMFLFQGRIGINLQDEGFLWYGAIRTHAGELPLRDFRAYDPGRYFWCAGWMSIFGDGLVVVRGAAWAFASLGVTAGLLTLARSLTPVLARTPWLVIAGVILVAWMTPPWKLYEASIAMIVAWSTVRLIESPTRSRTIAAGIAVGAAAFFGRNLGVYAAVSAVIVTAIACWKFRRSFVRACAELTLGTVVGYAPMLALIAFAPGYRAAFVDSIAFYARQGALNAELPMPFPWRLDLTGRSFEAAAAGVTIGTLFLLLPALYAVVVWCGVRARRSEAGNGDFTRWAPLVATALVGAAWFHHASVRSDRPHLAQSIHPFLITVLSLPFVLRVSHAVLVRSVIWLAAILATTFGVGTSLLPVQRAWPAEDEEFTTVLVGTERLILSPKQAGLVRGLLSAVEANVRPEDELWVTAQFIGLYPILGRRAPTWDIYPAWLADDREQERMLRELADVRYAIVDVRPIGGDPNMRLEVSHPRVWRWLLESFERLPLPGAPDAIVLLRRKI